MTSLRIGFHVSIAGGISNSVENAEEIGCSAFQIFTRNPRGWVAKPLAPDDAELFKQRLSKSDIKPESVVVHMPYLPNLSGPSGEIYSKSVHALEEEVQRCTSLGIRYLVIHLGSHMGKGTESGIMQLTSAIDAGMRGRDKAGSRNRLTILLENNAGQKNSIGANFEELRTILDRVASMKEGIGVCLDTCHLLASGYDIRSIGKVEKTLEKFDTVVGLRELKVIHLNDSKGELNSNLDRHQHIGLGSIRREGLSAFINHRTTRNLPFIMETPIDKTRGNKENMTAALKLAK